MTLLHRSRRLRAAPVAVVLLTLGLVGAPALNQSASASPASCADPITSAPSGPARVSTASTSFGRVLVVGSGPYAGCSLYLLTSDRLHRLSGGAVPFACSNNANPTGAPCASVLWPALLTRDRPVAGPGVKQGLLGTVTRTDVLSGQSVRQVTYAGLPLYRFFADETPGETEGANLFDPLTSPTGIWYLVEPKHGRPAPGRALLLRETAPVGGTGPDRTVLAARMNNDFSGFPDASFPVYKLSTDRRHSGKSACRGLCAAVPWPPVLTSGRPEAGPGVNQDALGTIERPDGTHQVTYRGKPLYLFFQDAYIPGLTGTKGIFGAGAHTPFGVFNTIPRH
jgi:predicted lipoprotein with Yx(FWY)xxD motif